MKNNNNYEIIINKIIIIIVIMSIKKISRVFSRFSYKDLYQII